MVSVIMLNGVTLCGIMLSVTAPLSEMRKNLEQLKKTVFRTNDVRTKFATPGAAINVDTAVTS